MGCTLRQKFVAPILAVVLVLGACTAVRKPLAPPQVSITDLHLVGLTLLEQRYALTLRVQNPNPVSFPITGMAFRLNLNGAEFARGVNAESVTIPAYGEELLDVVVTSNLAGAIGELNAHGGPSDRLRYELVGHVSVSGLPGRVRFSYEGEIGAAR